MYLEKTFSSVDELIVDAKSSILQLESLGICKQQVAIFDIDSTLLFYYGGFCPTIPRVKIVELHNWIKITHPQIEIIYITGRPKSELNMNQTLEELINSGCSIDIKTPPTIIMMDEQDSSTRNRLVGNYKFKAREEILSKKQIVLNIGDAWTDLFSGEVDTSNWGDFCKVNTYDSLLTYKLYYFHDK